jgi:hypothetical protein
MDVTTLNGNIGQRGLIINRLFKLHRLLLLSTTLLIKYNLGFWWVKFDSIEFCLVGLADFETKLKFQLGIWQLMSKMIRVFVIENN